MRIAVPVAQKMLCPHFGHCEEFMIFTVKDKKIEKIETLVPPPHEPGVIPKWLHEQKVNAILAGGMGSRAQQLFQQFNIQVIVGAEAQEPEKAVAAYLDEKLTTGSNLCDH